MRCLAPLDRRAGRCGGRGRELAFRRRVFRRSTGRGPGGREAVTPTTSLPAVSGAEQALPDVGVLCDVALDSFTSHGHEASSATAMCQ